MSAPITRRTVVALVLATSLGLTIGGCDLRVESPAPTEPSPSAAEVLRARAVSDALTLEQTARAASTAGTPAAVASVLDDVVTFSTRHAAELGGVYSSGLPGSASPSTVPTATAPPGTPADVLAVLTSSASEALGTADEVHDGGMARLLASVGTARAQLATRLAIALGLPVPSITRRATAATTPTATTSGAATAPTAPAPSGSTTPGTGGLSPAALDALTVVHDQAGYGLEVVAAKLSGSERSRALTAARAHRAAAEVWAVRAGTAATARDPRRAAYALPTGLADPAQARALARTLEDAVTTTDAAMVAMATAGSRGALIADLRTAADAAVSWGGAAVALPGLTGPAGPGAATTPTPGATPTA